MSSSRRTLESSATRRANRSQAASPYHRGAANRKTTQSSRTAEASAAAGEIKTSSSLVNLLSLLNPFRRRTEPPKSLPQIIQQQQQDRSPSTPLETSSDDDYRDKSDNDSRIVEDQLGGLTSAASSLMRSGKGALPIQIPFPTTSSPQSQGTSTPPRASLLPSNPNSRPITPGSARDPDRTRRSLAPVPPTPATGLGQSHGLLQTPFGPSRSALTLSQLGPSGTTLEHTETSPLKSLQNFIESRPRAGPLTTDELQKVENIVQATGFTNGSLADEDYGRPSAAFLGRGFVPGPSKSFLAPQVSTSTMPQSEFKFHVPTSTSFHTALTSGPSWTAPHTTSRKRPIYIGPGMSTQTRPHRSSMLIKSSTHGSLSSLNGTGRSGLRSTRTATDASRNALSTNEPNSTQDGKRRRIDDNSSSEPGPSKPPVLTIDVPAKPLPAAGVISPPKQVPRSVPLRSAITQLSSTNPAHPSPLRHMTKPNDSPSPPTVARSRTSGALIDILKEADKLNPPRGTGHKPEDFANPYENKSRPAPVQIKSKRPTPKPKEPTSRDKAGRNIGSKDKSSSAGVAPLAAKSTLPIASSSARSSYMPPVRSGRPARDAPSQQEIYTVDDVEMDDDIEEISVIPTSSKLGTKKELGQQNGASKPTLARKASQNLPPITVEEVVDDEDDSMSTSNKMNGISNGINRRAGIKPSLVIEPEEPRRYGRSPSLGPRFHSPTIPSPLRVVSMPAEDDTSSSSGMENGTPSRPVDASTEDMAGVEAESIHQVIARGIEKEKARKDVYSTPQDEAKALASSSLPKFSFVIPTPSITAFAAVIVGEQREAKGTEIAKLPKFTFDLVTLSKSSSSSLAPLNSLGSFGAPSSKPPNGMKVQAFDFQAAGLALPKEPTGGSWSCSICLCSNPSTATEKCSVCESPKPSSQPTSKETPTVPRSLDNVAPTTNSSSSASAPIPPMPTAFNWAAAGLAPKSTPAGSWTCSLCGLSNGESETKCTVCDTPR